MRWQDLLYLSSAGIPAAAKKEGMPQSTTTKIMGRKVQDPAAVGLDEDSEGAAAAEEQDG